MFYKAIQSIPFLNILLLCHIAVDSKVTLIMNYTV